MTIFQVFLEGIRLVFDSFSTLFARTYRGGSGTVGGPEFNKRTRMDLSRPKWAKWTVWCKMASPMLGSGSGIT